MALENLANLPAGTRIGLGRASSAIKDGGAQAGAVGMAGDTYTSSRQPQSQPQPDEAGQLIDAGGEKVVIGLVGCLGAGALALVATVTLPVAGVAVASGLASVLVIGWGCSQIKQGYDSRALEVGNEPLPPGLR